ncbi:hypothetical protein HRQ65_03280 [Tatlockia micdadei]|uniref:hypothetical protein n=1 Tax=Legionella micdadei TaxID=451 RepID=UPI00156F3D62|nr:hypothetical protein [Legionella micdadei]NSL17405.1 hypothetical protein [Legionella micdadei]
MNQDYLKNWTMMINEMQKPFRAMLELHVNTLKNLRYLRPEELSNLHLPGEMISRHLALAMENSHNMLNYMQQSFQIFENAFLSLSREMTENAGLPSRQIKINIEGEKKAPASRRKPTEKKASRAKSTKDLSQKSQTKTKVATTKASTKAESKTTASKPKTKLSAKKMSTAGTKQAQADKNTAESVRKLSVPEKKKSTSAKRPSTKAAAEPKKTLFTKNINSQGQKATIPEKKVMPEEKMPMPKASASMIDPKMNFSANKMPEPKLNMPQGTTSSTESKIIGSESIPNRFQDKNPFRK